MKHVFSVVGVGLVAFFLVVFFTGRVDSKRLPSVAPRVGLPAQELDAIVTRIAAQTGASLGTSRRVVFYLACSGVPTPSTMESQALQAADLSKKQRFTAREAAVYVLSGSALEGPQSPLRDC